MSLSANFRPASLPPEGWKPATVASRRIGHKFSDAKFMPRLKSSVKYTYRRPDWVD